MEDHDGTAVDEESDGALEYSENTCGEVVEEVYKEASGQLHIVADGWRGMHGLQTLRTGAGDEGMRRKSREQEKTAFYISRLGRTVASTADQAK